MRTVQQRISEVLAEIALVEAFSTPGKSLFLSDAKTQRAIERCYEIIGEALKSLPDSLLSRYDSVNWKRVIAFRDVLAHQYFRINIEYVWAAVEQLPALRVAVEAMASDPLVTADDDEA